VAAQYAISGTSAKGIAASVERGVADGTLGPGVALPPVRALADRLGVSPGTVATAYKELRQRGIVVTRGRGGTVVASAPAVASRRPPKVPAGLRDLAGGHPDPEFLPELPSSVQVTPGVRSHRSAPRLPELEALARAAFDRDGGTRDADGAGDAEQQTDLVGGEPGDVGVVERRSAVPEAGSDLVGEAHPEHAAAVAAARYEVLDVAAAAWDSHAPPPCPDVCIDTY
jgi:hypothetical protein